MAQTTYTATHRRSVAGQSHSKVRVRAATMDADTLVGYGISRGATEGSGKPPDAAANEFLGPVILQPAEQDASGNVYIKATDVAGYVTDGDITVVTTGAVAQDDPVYCVTAAGADRGKFASTDVGGTSILVADAKFLNAAIDNLARIGRKAV